MAIRHGQDSLSYDSNGRIDLGQLSQALHHCHDLAFLQSSPLAQLRSVARRARNGARSLPLGRALREELIDCAVSITKRRRHPVAQIVEAIEEGPGSQGLGWIKQSLGVPLPREKIDLARYYAIRLVIEGVKNETIAAFLEVDVRTVSSYIAQAKEHIRLALESKQLPHRSRSFRGPQV